MLLILIVTVLSFADFGMQTACGGIFPILHCRTQETGPHPESPHLSRDVHGCPTDWHRKIEIKVFQVGTFHFFVCFCWSPSSAVLSGEYQPCFSWGQCLSFHQQSQQPSLRWYSAKLPQCFVRSWGANKGICWTISSGWDLDICWTVVEPCSFPLQENYTWMIRLDAPVTSCYVFCHPFASIPCTCAGITCTPWWKKRTSSQGRCRSLFRSKRQLSKEGQRMTRAFLV